VLQPDREAQLKSYKIAVIEGDGIGREVVPEGIRVLEAAARARHIPVVEEF